jgi:cysteine-rich repeat protein
MRVSTALLICIWMFGGCGGDSVPSEGASMCAPGATQTCDCLVSGEVVTGVQSCTLSGASWHACECGAAGGDAAVAPSTQSDVTSAQDSGAEPGPVDDAWTGEDATSPVDDAWTGEDATSPVDDAGGADEDASSGEGDSAVPDEDTTTVEPSTVCGNGEQEAGEACDDGNVVDGDGCESDCQYAAPLCASTNFDGSDDYIELPDSDAWAFGAGDFSIALWARMEGMQARFLQQLSDNDNRLAFYRDNAGNLNFGQKQSGVYDEVSVPWTPTLGEWHHIALVRSGSALTYYADGNSIGMVTYSQEVVNLSAPMLVGWYVDGGNHHYLDGDMHSLAVWGAALESSDIEAQAAGAEPTGSTLQGYWVFDTHSSGTVLDRSSGANDGTAYASTIVDSCPSGCGDGETEDDEACDDGTANTDGGACAYGEMSCTFCSTGCEPVEGIVTGYCGDGAVQGDNEACDDENTVDGDGCSSLCTLETAGPSNYVIVHTGADGGVEGQRWGHPYYSDVSGDYEVVMDVASEQACADLCEGIAAFECAGFMYKFNGAHNEDAPGSWLDESCTLLEVLESNPTSVTWLHSCQML